MSPEVRARPGIDLSDQLNHRQAAGVNGPPPGPDARRRRGIIGAMGTPALALILLVAAIPGLPRPRTPAAVARQTEDPAALLSQARRLQLDGRLDESLAFYERALARNPDAFDAQIGVGIVLDLLGRYAEAQEHFARAIGLAPEGAKNQALTAMAVSCAFERNAACAAKYLQQEFDGQSARGNLQGASETANALGRIYLESGDLANAQTWYQTGYETARRQPGLPAAELDLADLRWAHARARIAARRGRADEAHAQVAAVEAIVAKGDNPEQAIQLPYLTGYVAFYLKDFPGAIDALQKADQKDPFIQVLLGQAFELVGEAGRARQLYQRVTDSTAHSINNAFARSVAMSKLK